MDTVMKMNKPYGQESSFRRWWNTLSFIQKRMLRMFMSMAVMILCFPLYYLGLFGTVDGPLHPSRIGDSLAGMGVTRIHSMTFFLSLLIIAVSWNWIYNLVNWSRGARMTCTHPLKKQASVCGATVQRTRSMQPQTGKNAWQYVCRDGHKRPNAHFHPIRKGTLSHCLWAIALGFAFIVIFMS